MSRHRRGERGIALALIAIALTAMLSICVVAIELGHLGVAVSEVQIAADSAATAATRSLLRNKITGGVESPATAGATVAAQNTVEGQPVDGTPGQVSVTQGIFNLTTGTFTPGGAAPNAAQVVATAPVSTVLAAMFGQTGSQVQRTAIAAYGGSCAAQAALPIALGDCLFASYQQSQDCATLPALKNVPDATNNTCWTSLGPNTADTSQASAYLPSQCCQGGNCGGGQSAPRLRTGSQINGLSGTDDVLLKIIKSCYDHGIREFVVPVIDCANAGNGNGNNGNGNGKNKNKGNGTGNPCGQTQVRGFATVQVKSVKASGADKGMEVTAVCSADDPGGAIGCTSYGNEAVALVK